MTCDDVAQEALRDALGSRVGVGRQLTIEELAAVLGRSVRTVRGWLGRESNPKWPDVRALCRLFGPAFADEILPPEARQQRLEALRRYQEDRDALLAIAGPRLAWLVPPQIDEAEDAPPLTRGGRP